MMGHVAISTREACGCDEICVVTFAVCWLTPCTMRFEFGIGVGGCVLPHTMGNRSFSVVRFSRSHFATYPDLCRQSDGLRVVELVKFVLDFRNFRFQFGDEFVCGSLFQLRDILDFDDSK